MQAFLSQRSIGSNRPYSIISYHSLTQSTSVHITGYSKMTWQIKQSDVWNWTEKLGLQVRRRGSWRRRLETETETATESGLRSKTQLWFVCQLGLCVFHCVCVWCECYGNLLSSAYTKLETRKALGNLHESCPQTAWPELAQRSGRGSTAQGEREGRDSGVLSREGSPGVDVKFLFDFHTQTQRSKQTEHTKGFFMLLQRRHGGHMWQLYWIPIHTQSYLAARLANRYESEREGERDLLRLYLGCLENDLSVMDLLRDGGNQLQLQVEWEECRLAICLMQLPFNNFKCDWNSQFPLPIPPILQ